MATAVNVRRALVALQRFGLGPKRGGLARIVDDPVGAVMQEVNHPERARLDGPQLANTAKAAYLSQRGYDKAEALRYTDLKARMHKQLQPEVGFLERLVMFWSNHFSMSVNKTETIRGQIGLFERTVIRPNVLGSFPAMLKAAIQSPAMIDYLDNDDSIGPNSKDGLSWGVGLNENLAREIMELHTLGSGGGYTETDVTQLARIITGWSYVRAWESQYHYNGGTKTNCGRFIYRPRWHEPGRIELRGKVYPAAGKAQGLAALHDLALDPATAQHLAFKLLLHFITDEPTPEMVKPLADAYAKSGGNLGAMTRAMLALPEAFDAPLTKIRTPYELCVAQFRALDTFFTNKDYWAVWAPLDAMHNQIWEHPTPDGYPDESAYWLDPDGMTIRLDTAMMIMQVYGSHLKITPNKLGKMLYGPALTDETRNRIWKAPDTLAGFTTLLMSPEFQRR